MRIVLDKQSLTLTELLIAVALMALLLVGVFTLENFANFQLVSSDRRTVLQNKASTCIEHISKNTMRAIGHVGNSAVTVVNDPEENYELQLRIDSNDNGKADSTTAIGGDRMVRYFLEWKDKDPDDLTQYELQYYNDYGRDSDTYTVLAKNVVNHLMDPPMPIFDCQGGIVRIELVLRHDPVQDEGRRNPQIRLLSRVLLGLETVR